MLIGCELNIIIYKDSITNTPEYVFGHDRLVTDWILPFEPRQENFPSDVPLYLNDSERV